MISKAAYVLVAGGSLALMLFEGPRGGVLTSAPERGKVERAAGSATPGNATVRRPGFIFIGGISRGK